MYFWKNILNNKIYNNIKIIRFSNLIRQRVIYFSTKVKKVTKPKIKSQPKLKNTKTIQKEKQKEKPQQCFKEVKETKVIPSDKTTKKETSPPVWKFTEFCGYYRKTARQTLVRGVVWQFVALPFHLIIIGVWSFLRIPYQTPSKHDPSKPSAPDQDLDPELDTLI